MSRHQDTLPEPSELFRDVLAFPVRDVPAFLVGAADGAVVAAAAAQAVFVRVLPSATTR